MMATQLIAAGRLSQRRIVHSNRHLRRSGAFAAQTCSPTVHCAHAEPYASASAFLLDTCTVLAAVQCLLHVMALLALRALCAVLVVHHVMAAAACHEREVQV